MFIYPQLPPLPPTGMFAPIEHMDIEGIYRQIVEGERVETVRRIETEWDTFGGQLGTIATTVRRIADSLDWESGEARDAFQERADYSIGKIRQTADVALEIKEALKELGDVMAEAHRSISELYGEYNELMDIFLAQDDPMNRWVMISEMRVRMEQEGMPPVFVYDPTTADTTQPDFGVGIYRGMWDAIARFRAENLGHEYLSAYRMLDPRGERIPNMPEEDNPYLGRFPSWTPLDYVVHPGAYQGEPPSYPPGFGGGGAPGLPPALPPPAPTPPPAPAPPPGPVPAVVPGLPQPIGQLSPPPQPGVLPQPLPPNAPAPNLPPSPPAPVPQQVSPVVPLPPGVAPPVLTSPGANQPGPPPVAGLRAGAPPPGAFAGNPGGSLPPATLDVSAPPGTLLGSSAPPEGAGGSLASAPAGNSLGPARAIPPGMGMPGMGMPPGMRPGMPGTGAPPGTRASQQRGNRDGTAPAVPPAGARPGMGMPPGAPGQREQRSAAPPTPPVTGTPAAFRPPASGFAPPVLGEPRRQRTRPGSAAEAPRAGSASSRAAPGSGTPPVLANQHRTGPRSTYTQQREQERLARQERVQRFREMLKSALGKGLPESTAPVLDGRVAAPQAQPVPAAELPEALRGGSRRPVEVDPHARPVPPADRATRRLLPERSAAPVEGEQEPAVADEQAWEVETPGGPVVSGERRRKPPAPRSRTLGTDNG